MLFLVIHKILNTHYQTHKFKVLLSLYKIRFGFVTIWNRSISFIKYLYVCIVSNITWIHRKWAPYLMLRYDSENMCGLYIFACCYFLCGFDPIPKAGPTQVYRTAKSHIVYKLKGYRSTRYEFCLVYHLFYC